VKRMAASSHSGLRRFLPFLYWEAAFAMAYETWVGLGWLSGLAGEVGISIQGMTLLAALPFVGFTGQLVGLLVFRPEGSVRRRTLKLAFMARTLWLAPLGVAAFLGVRSYRAGVAFPKEGFFLFLAATALLVSALAQSSAVSWMSWMRGLVRSEIRGRFFGSRQRATMMAVIVANFTGALLVGYKPQGWLLGYAALGGLAVISAMVSTWLLSRVPDLGQGARLVASAPLAVESPAGVRISGLADEGDHVRRVQNWVKPLRNPEYLRVLLFGAFFNGIVQLAGPFFSFWFTGELGIPMRDVALWGMLSNLGCLFASLYWGGRVDRTKNPVPVLVFCCTLIVLSPLPYVLPSASVIRLFAPLEFAINGSAWAGYQIGMTFLLFRAASGNPRESAIEFSLYTAASGLSGAFCALLGGQFAQLLVPWGGFRALWVLGSALRALVLILGVRWFLDSSRELPFTRGRQTRESSASS
jgi:hypothetical protein